LPRPIVNETLEKKRKTEKIKFKILYKKIIGIKSYNYRHCRKYNLSHIQIIQKLYGSRHGF